MRIRFLNAMRFQELLRIFCFVCVIGSVGRAIEPVSCPAGAPLGRFQLLVTNASGSAPRSMQTINQILPGYRIQYRPGPGRPPDKKARVSLVLVPSDKGSIAVLDPKPADKEEEWPTQFQTSIVALVYGPQGLDKGKVSDLVKKNDELVSQLAEYAQKTQQTEALIQAITQQQQALDNGQSVNAAVVSFANQYSGATRIDRTQPMDAQMATLLHGINPALSAYDPLASDPMQRAAQSAGLVAAIAGMFFGSEIGLGASAGALLFNMHGVFFPRTEFRSAFAQSQASSLALCGNKTPSASRTQLAFLWATRLPDSAAPGLSLPAVQHVALGEKQSIPVELKGRDPKLLTRVQEWKLVSADGKPSQPVTVKADASGKSIELEASGKDLTPGAWKLTGMWDWTPVTVGGEIDIHRLSSFDKARLAPDSQDRLTQGAGKVLIALTGDDFQFVNKLAWKSREDKFAQPSPAPFVLPKGPRAGIQTTLETQLDTGSLAAGDYEFLIAQSDGKDHPVPFRVLPAPPEITNLPLLVNTGEAAKITLRGKGLDRIQSLSADGAHIDIDPASKGDERGATVTLDASALDSSAKTGAKLALRVKVKDFEQPIVFTDALLVAGPRPVITSLRVSLPATSVEVAAGEIPASPSVSFELTFSNARRAKAVELYCAPASGENTSNLKRVVVPEGDTSGENRLRQQAPGLLFLAFDPGTVGPPGCDIAAQAQSAENGDSAPKKLGRIVLLPKIDSFQLTDQKAGTNSFYGEIRGQNLETIAKVGWDAGSGLTVNSIPAPSASGTNQETLRVELPWPAPAPHSPLYIWLRTEEKGRATTVKW